MDNNFSPDKLNEVGVLKRREIEARILIPFVEALTKEFGNEIIYTILKETIINIAREQGRALASSFEENDLRSFKRSLPAWMKDNALDIDIQEETDEVLTFNVIRCQYAKMYRVLGIPELGSLLSCNRDYSLIEGFNPDVQLTRTQTIMEGASHCDFQYSLKKA